METGRKIDAQKVVDIRNAWCNMDAMQDEHAFITELRELMKKHGVRSITAEDHYPGYPECGEDIRMTVEITGAWEGDKLVREYQELNLGGGFFSGL